MSPNTIKLYHHEKLVRFLGPGKRFGIWVQGCPFSCAGCCAPDSQPFDAGELFEIPALRDLVLKSRPQIEGITVSGGEPTLILSTQRTGGDFGGNFECRVQSGDATQDSEGWQTVAVPVSAFEPVAKQRHRHFRLENNTVTKLLISVHGNTSLQVSGLKISLNQENDETTN